MNNLNISGAARLNGLNVLDLIDEARIEPYVLPEDISLINLTTNKLAGIGFPEYIYLQGSLYPKGILDQIGNPVQKWLEVHFIKIYTDYLEVDDSSGGGAGACS